MAYTRDYYPLTPRRGYYSQPNTVYLYVEMAGDRFELAASVDDGLRYFNSLRDVISYIVGLPNKTWVITYGLSFWAAAFMIFPEIADSVSGIGSNRLGELDVKIGRSIIYIIDASTFFGDSLHGAMQKAGLLWSSCQPERKYKDGLSGYTEKRVTGIMQLWERFRDAVYSIYGVHPSKTPGATALKTFRTSLVNPISVRGKPFTNFNRESILPGYLFWKTGYYPEVFSYDINGSYPSVMRSIQYPLTFCGFVGSAPPLSRWIATVRVNYSSLRDFSPLMVRLKDAGYCHPIKASGLLVTLSYIDMLTLQIGGELEITEWIEGIAWSPDDERPLFEGWVNQIENHNARIPDDKSILKVMSRSLHSKFAQKPGIPLVEYRRIGPVDMMSDDGRIKEIFLTDNGEQIAKIEYIKEPEFQPYIRPDFELLTAAAARLVVYSAIDNDTVYCDTDSIISTKPRPDLPIGPNFGQWKNAGSGPLWLLGPRLYRMGDRVKAAGILPVDYGELREGITNVKDSQPVIVGAVENPTMSHPDRSIITREHTLQKSEYLFGEVTGEVFRAYSGEEFFVLTPGRYFSSNPENRKLHF